jgi:hypothetical protein
MKESDEEIPPLPQGNGPGPDLDPTNSELELHTISLAQPESDFVVNNNSHNGTMRTIDSDDCAQPEQRPRLDDVARDTSTIFSQRSGTDTLDTEPTIQRGSRSKKPSPDDQPTAQPAQVSHSDNNNQIPCEVTTIPTHLSFPSPPSVDDEEVVMQKMSLCIQGGLETIMGSVSTTEATNHNNHKDQGNRTTTTAKKSSPMQRFLIILVALVVIVIVIVVVIKVTNGKEDNSELVQTNHGMAEATQSLRPMIPSAAPTTPLPSEPLPTTIEDEILFLSGNVTAFNQTDAWIGDNVTWDDGESQSPTIDLVPAEEDATVSPSHRGATP